MTKYLLNLGHHHILYIRNHGSSAAEMMKFSGYKSALTENSELPYVLDVEKDSLEEGYRIGKEVMEEIKRHQITAIFCCRDALAIGLCNYFYDNSISIPKEISISGYGGDPLTSIYRPTVTTVLEPYYDMGAIAIRKLVKNTDETTRGSAFFRKSCAATAASRSSVRSDKSNGGS